MSPTWFFAIIALLSVGVPGRGWCSQCSIIILVQVLKLFYAKMILLDSGNDGEVLIELLRQCLLALDALKFL
jgi:hypothetical protein